MRIGSVAPVKPNLVQIAKSGPEFYHLRQREGLKLGLCDPLLPGEEAAVLEVVLVDVEEEVLSKTIVETMAKPSRLHCRRELCQQVICAR